LILGRRELIEACKKHPLARALRVGKLTLSALQTTLLHYLRGEAEDKLPIWQMCSQSGEEIAERAAVVVQGISQGLPPYPRIQVETVAGRSPIGGGSLPGETLPTTMISIAGSGSESGSVSGTGGGDSKCEFKAEKLAAVLRESSPPVVARVEEGRLLLDLRTVLPEQDEELVEVLRAALQHID
jgi:L-seryl-tRNA(Ser) seleniumtransferase